MRRTTQLVSWLVICFLWQNHSVSQDCSLPDNIQQLNTNDVFNTLEYGQSFTATCNGTIKSIRVYTDEVTQAVNGQLKFYNEVPFTGPDPNFTPINGTNGQTVSWSTSSSETMQTIVLSTPLAVTSGQDYTFIIEGTIGKVAYSILDSFDDNSLDYTGGFLFGRQPNSFLTRYTDRDLKFEVHYTDVIPPVANCKNATIFLDASGNASLSHPQINNGSSGGVAAFQLSQNTFDCNDIGANTVTLTVFDNASNSDNCDATVTVVDNIAPVNLSCPENISREECSDAIVTYDMPTFSDNTDADCPLTVELVEGFASGALFPVNQTTTVTYRATDAGGNTAECSFTVFIGDTVFPILNGIPNNRTVNATGTNCEGFIPFYNTVQIDNCGATLTQTEGIAGTGPFPLGVTTNTFELEDAAGNITTKSFTVTVVDNQDPVFDTCPSNDTFLVDSGQTTANISFTEPTATDFCGGVTVTQTAGLASGSDFPIGDTFMEFTATDTAGNTSICSFTYTVLETSPLIITGVVNNFSSNSAIELYVVDDIPDLSLYAIGVANGGGGSDSQEYYLTGSASAGEFIYLAARPILFQNVYGFAPDFHLGNSDALNPSGDDAVELFFNSGGAPTLVDTFGDINTDGTGTDWDYHISWAYRMNNSGPDGGFEINNWRLPNGDVLQYNDGSTNATALIPFPIGTYGQPYDNTAPTAVCLNPTVTVVSNSFELTGDTIDGGSTDNEGIVLKLVDDGSNDILRCNDGGSTQYDLTVYDAAGNKATCTSNVNVVIGPSQVICEDITVTLNLEGEVTVNDFDIFNGSEGPCIGKGATLYLTETDPGAGGGGGLFAGETTTGSPTDDLFDTGVGLYYQEFSFTVPTDGLYTPSFSFVPSISDDDVFLLALVYDQPVVPNSGPVEDRTEFLEGFFYSPPSILLGAITGPDDAEVFLNAGTTYYMQVAIVNVGGPDITAVTGTFDGDLDGTPGAGQMDSITYTADDLGENTLYLVSIDELGRFSYCESTVTVVENRSLPIYISEYQPTTTNSIQEIEIYGTPGEAFSGAFVVIQGNTDTGEVGVVKGLEIFGGTFDANGLLLTTIPNIANPSHTVVLTSSFSGTVNVTDIDTDDDGVADDLSAFGVIVDAVGVGDGSICCPEDVLYATELGGVNLPNIGGLPSAIFREATVGDFYQISNTSGDIFDSSGNQVDASLFDVIPDSDGTFGTINPAPFASSTSTFVTTWKTDNRGNSDDDQITIYTDNTLTYDYSIDWGDGTVQRNVSGDVTHTYSTLGTYTIKIAGTFPKFGSNGSFFGDAEKLISIDQWGTIEWSSFEDAFGECENMDLLATDIPNLSNVTSMRGMFVNCQSMVANATINDWDVSNVQNMQLTFNSTTNFNQPLDNWNVSNVTTMESMFNGAESFNQDINSWNTSQVETMRFMFTGAYDFNQSIDNWNVSNVMDMGWMFNNAEDFNQDLNNWNVSQVQDMFFMFLGATNFNGNISNWNPAQVTTMYGMFQNAVNFNQDISGWNVSQVTDMGWMLNGATQFNQPIGNWDVSNLELANEMLIGTAFTSEHYDSLLLAWSQLTLQDDVNFGTDATYCLGDLAKQEIITNFNWIFNDGGLDCDTADYFVMTWQTDNPGDSSDTSITIPTFLGETYNYQVDWSYDGVTFNVEDANVTGDITHDYGTPGTYTVAISGTFPRIYFDDGGDHDKILTIEQWGSIQWTSMEGAFDDCANLNITNPTIDTPDLSNVTSLKDMFSDCLSFNANIENWDVSNVEIFDEMFSTCIVFDQPLNGWAMTSATSLSYMFYEAESFNQPLNGWVTTSVTNMEGVFASALAFDQDLNNWNTSNVTSMYEMFDAAEVFDGDISTWNVSNVEDMEALFDGAYLFNQDISNWNVGNVQDMTDMFAGAEAFNQDISGWNVSSVTNMYRMFRGADDFDQNLGAWDLTSIVDIGFHDGMEDMFGSGPGGIQMSLANYDATLIGWNTDSSGLDGDGIDDIPQNVTFGGGKNKYCNSEVERQNLIDTHGWAISDNGYDGSCLLSAVVSPIVYLQGTAINPNSGEESLMRDDLRVDGLLQTTSPYGDAAIAEASVFAVAGSEAIVDWVWVELRDESDSDVVIDGQSALLQRDGDVVATDGFSPVTFQQPEGSYFVVVNHRNHVGIITATTQPLTSTTSLVDLTADPASVEGGTNSVILLPNGKYAMYSGDFDGNAQIQNSDATAVIQLIGDSGYQNADLDLNTQIQNSDVNAFINPNIGRGEQFSRPGVSTEFLSTDVTLAFANALITNDGVDDYYEADIMISGTTDFYVGSGQVYLDYNTAAFGENVSTNNNIEYSQPDGTILGYSFGAFSPAYKDFIQNDNTTSRVSLSFQQNVGLTGLETAPELEITSTPKVLFHVKIRYVDSSADANICFYSEGVFQDQFFTACGGAATADCTNTPGVQITNDSYDCSEAGVGTLSIASFETDQILLYPNPTSSSFRIKGLSTISQIRIYDVNGRLILEEQHNDDRAIEMNGYANGVYFVEIESEHGMLIKRLVKKQI
ncbi:BspA family leucine-rich repeat surface protein [Winogradskyella sp.]|uniref:BspA family leucine-rich repeat surface protein n=1 Tax=Winogradskyella sp. TaxID=1883156 RepID=UPI003BABED04